MTTTEQIIARINSILESKESVRIPLIQDFQSEIWEDDQHFGETVDDILSTLAYDLDFYEPNDEFRREDVIYYDNAKLEVILKSALDALKNAVGNS
ncbi:hypothetical protein [Dyadobacter sp. CY323]|uniref:hypothetical protein n=1 Tax=Dyadobacter sp. CY323 TaxID=2907302 RepID=UPI001F45FD7B|nr:hypothetical protein [Dyadobacter sp. CY323]MCE6988169.1 hypothetical protein [Dyadobacter sp. CY323]